MKRPNRKDVGLAVLAAFLVAEGPLTPPALGPSLVAGALAAGALLFFRLSDYSARRRARTQLETAQEPIEASHWNVPAGVWLCLGALALVFGPTWLWMYGQWTGSVWLNTHGLFIPVLMAMLARSTLRRMTPAPDPPSAWGLAFLLPGLVLVVVDAGASTHYLAAVGFVLTLPGLSLLLLGPRRTRALTLPLVLGVFMIPLPNAFATQVYLRDLTAEAVAPLLTLLGTRTLVQDSVLELAHHTYFVANACSGISTLYSALAIAVILCTLCRSRVRRVLICLSVVPITFAVNVARVAALVLISLHIDHGLLDTALHGASGVATLLMVIGALMLLADRPALRRAFT